MNKKTKLYVFLFPAGSIISNLLFAKYIQQGSKLLGTGAIGPLTRGMSVSLTGYWNGALVGGPGDSSGRGAMWYYIQTNGICSYSCEKSEVTGNIHSAIRCKNVVERYPILSFDFRQSIDHQETHIHKIESPSGGHHDKFL
jgi:hypothetical protein